MSALSFEILARSATCHARVGKVTTRHGAFDTPAFMPVGTKATIKGILPNLVAATGAQVVLGNTLHLLLRPGPELIERQGGLHAFMGWPGPILTDSGGYQAYSLADTNRVTDDSVVFKSIVDGSMVELTPERAIDTQNKLGADIIMAFDDCPPSVDPATLNQARLRLAAKRDAGRQGYNHDQRLEIANERTIRWLERCAAAHARPNDQSLFGIVQGGTDLARRDWCIDRVCAIDLPGYAIGGVAVGEGHDEIVRVVEHSAPRLPENKPRYLMGVGYERDLVAAVRSGVDMFDCVLPTRNGRNATAFTPAGQIRLRNASFAEDPAPIDATCDCLACSPSIHGWATPDGRPFGRAYIRHLFMADEMLGPILVTLHNLRHFQRLMLDIRAAIRDDAWSSLTRRWPVLARSRDEQPGRAAEARQDEP